MKIPNGIPEKHNQVQVLLDPLRPPHAPAQRVGARQTEFVPTLTEALRGQRSNFEHLHTITNLLLVVPPGVLEEGVEEDCDFLWS